MTLVRSKVPASAVALVAIAVVTSVAVQTYRHNIYFDDAFMFYRYATNFRHGLGWSWNADGVHTYGMTSLTWQFAILLFSFLPFSPACTLIVASVLTYFAAVAYLATSMARQARSPWLSSFGSALAFVTVPLLLQVAFHMNYTSGMETMLAFLLSGSVACLSVRLWSMPTMRLTIAVGIVAYLSVATRPESALCAVGVPLLAIALASPSPRFKLVLAHLGIVALLAGGQLAWSQLYFGTPLPLAFYLKTRNAYAGFTGYDGPAAGLAYTASYLALYLLILVLFATKRTLRPLAALLIPAVCTVAYLSTVIQIMGMHGRYYVPYLPYVMVAAWIVLDDAATHSLPLIQRRVVMLAILVAAVTWSNLSSVVDISGARYAAKHPPMPVPALLPPAVKPLPSMPPMQAVVGFSNRLARRMPAGSWLAATEVGYLGVAAPHVNILDLAGLNSRDQTVSGLGSDLLFRQNPDVIWMPTGAYTGMVGAILRDRRFLERYDLVAGAYDFGVAVRKGSAQHDAVLQQIAADWPQIYPGTRMTDYIVHIP